MRFSTHLLKEKLRRNTLLLDFCGSLGDLGTFLPIALALIMINKVNGIALFVTAGLFYILTGIYFRIPVPIQPLKATSALAIAIGASASTVSSVAFFMGIFLLALNFLKLDKLLSAIFTRPIIRGIQLGLAVTLVKSSLKLIFGPLTHTHFSVLGDSLNLYQGFFLLFLPQLPLTLGNSVYASSDTARFYFGKKASRFNPAAIFMSLGIGNFISGCLGGIPFCHGSSGITAHYRFGARSAMSNVFIGSAFILVAFAFWAGAGAVIKIIPMWLLGLALAYIGICHGALIKDIIRYPGELFIALFIGLYTFISGNLGVAFVIGIVIERIFRNGVALEKTCNC